jgi:hypothetical protein
MGGASACFIDEDNSRSRDSKMAALFNTEHGTWTQLPSMPESCFHAGVFSVGLKIYVLGGEFASEGPLAHLVLILN